MLQRSYKDKKHFGLDDTCAHSLTDRSGTTLRKYIDDAPICQRRQLHSHYVTSVCLLTTKSVD